MLLVVEQRLEDPDEHADDGEERGDGHGLEAAVEELMDGDPHRPVPLVRVDLRQQGEVAVAEAQVLGEPLEEA